MTKITVDLTPGEIVECIHALKSMLRFNNTEQRDRNESAIIALKNAYAQYATTDTDFRESRSSDTDFRESRNSL